MASSSKSSSQHPPSKQPIIINPMTPSQQHLFLSTSSHLTRQELLTRRLHNITRLSKVYRDHYWSLMDDLRLHFRDYYWNYGISPYNINNHLHHLNSTTIHSHPHFLEGCDENNNSNNNNNNNIINVGGKLGLGFVENGNNRCASVGCKLKAMALTSFCHLHILSDPQQKLYKPCTYVIKSAQAGPILCGKSILRSAVPSLCNIHFQKAQKHVTRALKKAGLNATASSKLAPKFHVIVAEYVQQIQSKRRADRKADGKITINEETTS